MKTVEAGLPAAVSSLLHALLHLSRTIAFAPRRRLRASFSRSLAGGSCMVGAVCTEWTGVPREG